MHQVQWVRAHARSLDEALTLFTAHVKQHGTVDNWWHWTMARPPRGAVQVRPLEAWEKKDLTKAELSARQRRARAAPSVWASRQLWEVQAWCAVWTQLGLQGLEPITLGEASSAQRATLARVRATNTRELPQRFLAVTLEALRAGYAKASLEDLSMFASISSGTRAARAAAFERVFQLLAGGLPDAEALPFLRDESPNDWPAHLVGELGAPAFLIAIDMHL
jgi:hypothetical protein